MIVKVTQNLSFTTRANWAENITHVWTRFQRLLSKEIYLGLGVCSCEQRWALAIVGAVIGFAVFTAFRYFTTIQNTALFQILSHYRIPQIGVGTCIFAVFWSLLKGLKLGVCVISLHNALFKYFISLPHTTSCCYPLPHYRILHFFIAPTSGCKCSLDN